MIITEISSAWIQGHDRLDANYFTAPGVDVSARIAKLQRAGMEVARLGGSSGLGKVWDPSRFARAYASKLEGGVPYLRPYDAFDYLPAASERLSIDRSRNLDSLRLSEGTILATCSGRNLGPVAYVDGFLSEFALSHDMIRIEIEDAQTRFYVLAFLKSRFGQALLQRGMAGSVIDHITVADVQDLQIPMVKTAQMEEISGRVAEALLAISEGRSELRVLVDAVDARTPELDHDFKQTWSQSSGSILDRLDAGYYAPDVTVARQLVLKASGVALGELAKANLPVRYKRYYVERPHGRAILSGRQLLQVEPINLRHVSDRSFRNPEDYELSEGMTVFGAVGRAEGRQGTPALITRDRAGWLASNDVMRLQPNVGVSPGRVWLSVVAQSTRLQINALSFGSVIDHLNPWSVEEILVPDFPEALALSAHEAWIKVTEGNRLLNETVALIDSELG